MNGDEEYDYLVADAIAVSVVDAALPCDDDVPMAVVLSSQRASLFDGKIDAEHVDESLVELSEMRAAYGGVLSPDIFNDIQDGCACSSSWNRDRQGLGGVLCGDLLTRLEASPEDALFVSPSGRSPLHEACLFGCCTHIIYALVRACPYVALDQDEDGCTPLHLLFLDYSELRVLKGEEIDMICKELLSINPIFLAGVVNAEGYTALHTACLAPSAMVEASSIDQLLDANPSCATIVSNKRETALHFYCKKKYAELETIQNIYSAYTEAVGIVDATKGWTPLHYSLDLGNISAVEFFVTWDPDSSRIRTEANSFSSLQLLCQRVFRPSHFQLIQLLVRADPASITHTDSFLSRTPIHELCAWSEDIPIEVIRTLAGVDAKSISIADNKKYLPIHYACEKGSDPNVVELLLEMYPPSALGVTRKNDTALSLACTKNRWDQVVRRLAESNPLALEQKNDYGYIPLHCACRAHSPQYSIVKSLLTTNPTSVLLKTNAGETPLHLACNNSTTGAIVIRLLAEATFKCLEKYVSDTDSRSDDSESWMKNKIGNTPLHDACFRGLPLSHIEALTDAKPEWVLSQNNAGHLPWQILCKNGNATKEIIDLFLRVGGPKAFSVSDAAGNTPLHSILRAGVDISTVKSLISVVPDCLISTTIYKDSPLHIACLRGVAPEIIEEVAMLSSKVNPLQVLQENSSGQSPISMAKASFDDYIQGISACDDVASEVAPLRNNAFKVLAMMTKIIYYGPDRAAKEEGIPLVHACLSLHEKGVVLNPIFIRMAIHKYPQELRMMAGHDNDYPLHIESKIPINDMPSLDGDKSFRSEQCHLRSRVLPLLFKSFPAAAETHNALNQFPLGLMIQSGRAWNDCISSVFRQFPPAYHWCPEIRQQLLFRVLEKVGNDCGADSLYQLIRSRPEILASDTMAGGGPNQQH